MGIWWLLLWYHFFHFSNRLWLPSSRDMFYFAQSVASMEWIPFLAPKVDPDWFETTRVSHFLVEATGSRMGTGPIATEKKEVPFAGGSWEEGGSLCVL